jgi:hypothetical protein
MALQEARDQGSELDEKKTIERSFMGETSVASLKWARFRGKMAAGG